MNKVMVMQSKRYRVFRLYSNEPYLLIRAHDPYAMRALGAIVDVLHNSELHDDEVLLAMAESFLNWQMQNPGLVKLDMDFRDFELKAMDELKLYRKEPQASEGGQAS